ncbi:hypothetical protein [uncultured Lactococcus sp.]|uniref:hypothetical protein n=1 Tax=uncultured Lactococcus sp. TaxID=167973 RepID=UPI0027DD9948|nr:hypothetical protein [uncultured Lactococcus sp.]
MKKKYIISALLLIGLIGGSAAAAELDPEKQLDGKANVDVSVSVPESERLRLVKTPDIDFGTVTYHDEIIADLVFGATVPEAFEILNLTGTNAGFHVNQKYSHFTTTVAGESEPRVLPIRAIELSVTGGPATLTNATGAIAYGLLNPGEPNPEYGPIEARVLTGLPNANGTLTSGSLLAEMIIDGTRLTQVVPDVEYEATITTTIVSGL